MRVQQVPNSPYFIHYDDNGYCCKNPTILIVGVCQRTAPFNPDKETYDLYKAFAQAFQENEREERKFPEELKNAVNKAYGNGFYAGRHSNL